MATLTLTRSGSTLSPLVVSGTIQGTTTLTSDYTVAGFDSFLTTAWAATIPAGSSTKTVEVSTAPDVLIEYTESMFLTITSPTSVTFSGNKTALVTLTADDGKLLSRIVAAGSTIIGTPTVTGASIGCLSPNPELVIYPAANQTIYSSTVEQSILLGGNKSLIEFEMSVFGPQGGDNHRFTWDLYGNTTQIFKCEYKGTAPGFLWGGRGVNPFIQPHPYNTLALWQVFLQGGLARFYINGGLSWASPYTIDTNVFTLSHKAFTGTKGGCVFRGCKIRSGEFDWTPGVYTP